MKRESDRKCLNHARVHASAQSFDHCENQSSPSQPQAKRIVGSGDENAVKLPQSPFFSRRKAELVINLIVNDTPIDDNRTENKTN